MMATEDKMKRMNIGAFENWQKGDARFKWKYRKGAIRFFYCNKERATHKIDS